MRGAEQAACLFWLVLAGALCVGAARLELGSFSEPRPGFLPLGSGALLGVLALIHLLQVSLAGPRDGEISFREGGERRGRVGLVVGALVAYALILPYLGYLLSTFAFMGLLFSLSDRRRWWLVAGASLVTTSLTYLIFHGWLKVQFPAGPWG